MLTTCPAITLAPPPMRGFAEVARLDMRFGVYRLAVSDPFEQADILRARDWLVIETFQDLL